MSPSRRVNLPPAAISTASVANTSPVSVISPKIVVDGKYIVPSLEEREPEAVAPVPEDEKEVIVLEAPDPVGVD